MFRPSESYVIRHRILKVLFESAQKEENPRYPQNRISLAQISKETNIPYAKLNIYHEILHEENEIDCKHNQEDHYLLLLTKGRQSYIYEKYLKIGSKEKKDYLKDLFAIFSPAIAITMALTSLVISTLNYIEEANVISQHKISQSFPKKMKANKSPSTEYYH